MTWAPRPVAGIKECCTKPENVRLESAEGDREVHRCQVCRCRHFRLKAGKVLEPGRMTIS